jgi:hypothetical protein
MQRIARIGRHFELYLLAINLGLEHRRLATVEIMVAVPHKV